MSNYNSLKTTIDANIKQNGNQEITGQILNSVLNQMVTTLGAGYQFAGVATIATEPGTPDAKVFYIANGKGTYEKFGGINVTEDEVVVLYWDSSWHKVSTGIAREENLTNLEKEVATKANLQHQHTVSDITDFPELYYDATTFFTSGAYPSDKYEELLEAVKAKKTVYATLDEEGYVSYVFFTSSANSDVSSSRVLLTTIFADGDSLYLNTFVLKQSGMTRMQENITSKANEADVYTKAQADAITNALADSLSRILRDFGMYSNPTEYVLAVGASGKYIDKDSALEVANGNYSISQPISLKAGDILLVPSASAVAAACSVVSKKVTNTYDKVIIYAYTYDEFGRINTATADYNPSLVYTAYYESDEQTTPTNWIRGGEHIAELPETHEVTESFYEPLVKQSVAGMPETGYYVYLASQAMDVVVSAYNATINGGHAIIAGWGIFKNVATNFVGIDKQRVIAEAIAALFAQVEGINEKLTNGLDRLSVKHLHIDRELSGLNIAGSFCLQGAGVPSASVVPVNWDFGRYGDWKGIPQFIGQEYFDTIDKVFYKAHGVTAVSDWKRITNA